MTRWVVVGAGYTGARVAARLAARGDAVVVTRRRREDAAAVAPAGAEPRAVELGDPATLAGLVVAGDVVVITAEPTDAAATGDGHLAAAAAAAAVARLVYVSSTGVYGPGHGDWVDEEAALAPTSASGRARVAAEAALRRSGRPTVVLRAAGIYGPGRGVIARLRAGAYRAIGDGRTATSRIHVDDLVTAIIAAGDHAAPAEVYNVADDDPGPTRELVAAVVAGFGLPWPPAIAISGVAPEVAAMVTADRRISNARLKAHLGVRLRYPSWRTALAEDLA